MSINLTLMKNHQSLQGYQDENGKFHSFPGKRQKEKQALMLQYLASKFCLLYTSPSPRDRTRSRMPSSA